MLIFIGVILVALAISALWLNRTIMIEDRWVDTMAPLAQNSAIQDYVAKSTADAIFANVDIQKYVADALGTPAVAAAAPGADDAHHQRHPELHQRGGHQVHALVAVRDRLGEDAATLAQGVHGGHLGQVHRGRHQAGRHGHP